jgi:hypothetical protein
MQVTAMGIPRVAGEVQVALTVICQLWLNSSSRDPHQPDTTR